jgi:arabinogalactan endo-1,4-beta-galactosidase
MVHDSGYTFSTQQGTAEPCLDVLKSVGIDSVRLRVWLNPVGGWNGQGDVVAKALAANALGQRVMLDFHYSDTWASGSSQAPPAAWAGYDMAQMEAAVVTETASVLNAIKSGGGTVSWVQVGNEINVGMLFPLGGVYGTGDNSFPNLAGLINSGYDAVKSVFPDALVIVHLSSGENDSLFESFFDALKAAGGKFDVIGASAYPFWSGLTWQDEVTDVSATLKEMRSRYGVPTMICECGYVESDPANCYNYLKALIVAANANGALGVFYWEPECYGSWPTASAGGAYGLGAFTAGGQPSAGLNAFLDSAVPPLFAGKVASQTIAAGSTVVFNAAVGAFPSPEYQWSLNGTPIPGATGPSLLVSGATAANSGSYTCVASNPSGSVTSNVASLSVVTTSNPGRLTNLSCRAQVGTGANIMTAGFVTGGGGTSGNQSVLIRASGPALSVFGLTGLLADPKLVLNDVSASPSAVVDTDAGWNGAVALFDESATLGAFSWGSAATPDSALLEALPRANYTAQLSGAAGDSGLALIEVYDATPAGTYTLTTPRLTNLSALIQVGTGANVVFAGFVIGGSTAKTMLIRATGPSLSAFSIAGLPDPELTLTNTSANPSVVVATNTVWGGDATLDRVAGSVGAFHWSLVSGDSAILITLPPGNYTAGVKGASSDTGPSLIELYEVP